METWVLGVDVSVPVYSPIQEGDAGSYLRDDGTVNHVHVLRVSAPCWDLNCSLSCGFDCEAPTVCCPRTGMANGGSVMRQ